MNKAGGHGEGETPEPIPNSAVKPCGAGVPACEPMVTTRATSWESRTPPDLFS
jgi:hypothetical protein